MLNRVIELKYSALEMFGRIGKIIKAYKLFRKDPNFKVDVTERV